MKAVIVAAGRSSRLYPRTIDSPKPLLKIGSRSIIERSLDTLHANGINDVLVVVGFHQDKLRRTLGERARFVLNPFFPQTNNMVSLWLAIPHLQGEEFIYLHGDVVYDEVLLSRLVSETAEFDVHLLVDFESIDEEAMKVRILNGRFVESSKAIPLDEAAGEWTGLAHITAAASKQLYSSIETLLAQERFQDYDTAAFNHLSQRGITFGLTPTDSLPWCEIDTEADYVRAQSLFDAK